MNPDLQIDTIHNGSGSGLVANMLLNNGFGAYALRPYKKKVGSHESFVDVPNGKSWKTIRSNAATATLTKDQWKLLDTTVVDVARQRLAAVADLQAAGLVMNIQEGMGKSILETQYISDAGSASIDMDGLTPSRRDRPEFDLVGLPLPIIHSGFSFSLREIAASQMAGGQPLDTTMAGLCGRRVAEAAEKLLTGTYGTFKFGGGNIYGYTNFPSRITKTITNPSSTGWTPKETLDDVISMRKAAYDKNHYGPYRLYVSPAWDQYLDVDYSESKGNNTLRERLLAVRGIDAISTLDYLAADNSTFVMVLVEMNAQVVREVIGMNITPVQWTTEGGLRFHYKVMAIMVPQLRADFNGQTGIVHATTA